MELKQTWITSKRNSNALNVCRVYGFKQSELPLGEYGLTPHYAISEYCGVDFGYENMIINALKRYCEK
jgi:hypothetical protein